MKKGTTFCFLLIIGLIMLSSFSVSAKSLTTTTNIKVSNYVQIADGVRFEDGNLSCDGDNAILGNVNDENSVAWLVNEILNYLKIIGPFLVLILSSIEFVKAILMSDDESLSKAQKNLITRLILAAALFVLPILISVILNVFGITSNEICIFQ